MNLKIFVVGLNLLLFGFVQAQDLTAHQNQLETVLKSLELSPIWAADKKSLTVIYEGAEYSITFYANRQSEADEYTVFLSCQSKTGVKAPYLDGIYAINAACTQYYTAKGYLDNFDPEKTNNSDVYEIVTSADILMTKPTSLSTESLKWTLMVMNNFSNRVRKEINENVNKVEEPKKKKEVAPSTPVEETNQSSNETESQPTEKEDKKAARKRKAKSTFNSIINSL